MCNFSLERHIIAALHFNHNLHWDVKKNPDGTEQVKVVWPKFKNGEATVRDVKVEPNFGKMQTIRFQNIYEIVFLYYLHQYSEHWRTKINIWCLITAKLWKWFTGISVVFRFHQGESIDQFQYVKFSLKQ